MDTAISRMKDSFKKLNSLLEEHYYFIEFHGKDMKSNNFNDKGYTKAVTSDFLRIYKPKNSLLNKHSFSFAFNNYTSINSGIIVGLKTPSGFESAPFTFSEFKDLFKKLINQTTALQTSERCDLSLLMKSTFSLNTKGVDLEPFFNDLVDNLKSTEDSFMVHSSAINQIKDKLNELNPSSASEIKIKRKELEADLEVHISTLKEIQDSYEKIVIQNVDKIINDQPYLSRRLIGKLIAPLLSKHKTNSALKVILELNLNYSPGFTTHSELYSD